ncbi:uncharacterized protein LOC131597340 [Vicia villosa]|uniref:uncharacterized protein LOC131597340 n=1 Tax=Vicia villosa TaxID=3911 RepID=UPI00273CCDB8|nr:uncharacterized protein LOC131597340 [Vicia villosa]
MERVEDGGLGMFVLKEKLKQIKERLKEWHKNHSQNLGEKIKAAKSELNRLEVKEESMGLADEEINSKRETSASLYNLSKLECSIQWQKSRSKWVKEGDANTKYFHGCVKKRRRENEILALEVNGNMLKGAGEIKNAIVEHFKNHFSVRGVRPILENMHFKRINETAVNELIQAFSEDKIRKAVWECDSTKSPGPDGVNFGFVK